VQLLPLKVCLDHSNKCVLTFFKPLNQRLSWVFREVFTLYDKVVEVIAKVLCTNMPSVAIKDPEEADLGPLTLPLLILGLQNIEYNGDPVFIVLSDDTLIGVGRVGLHDSALLVRCLCHLVVLELERLGI